MGSESMALRTVPIWARAHAISLKARLPLSGESA
jgi:hypothetical protein